MGQYELLRDAYLDPSVLYKELDLDAFAGRRWLVEEIDAFIRETDSGYVVLEAEAGMGKSAFLAWLARERGFPHHFVRLMKDPNDIGIALRSLASQLITHWDLIDAAPGGVIPTSAGRPDFFYELLSLAAVRRDETRPGEQIVIAVDGLNETIPPAGVNPLGLPRILPTGVYVIASKRPVYVPLAVTAPRRVIRIDRQSDENQNDVGEYLGNIAASHEIADRLAAAGMSRDEFVQKLLARSGGVWIYLHYVLAEIRRGARSPPDLDDLPFNVWQYYAQFWLAWQQARGDRWVTVDLRVLAVLGAVAEPIPASTFAEVAGIRAADDAAQLLDGPWRPFVEVDERERPWTYRSYHDSLREFLAGDVDPSRLLSDEQAFVSGVATATRAAHARFADRALTDWGTLARGLPTLVSGVSADGGSYGQRHVIEHLALGGRDDDLHALLSLSWPIGGRSANAWFTVHARDGDLGAYRRDLTTAFHAVRRTATATRTVLLLRYALMLASLVSRAATTPPGLWRLLVRDGYIAPREAIDSARQMPAAEERAEALTSLIDVVPDDLRAEVTQEALAAVRTVPDGYWRVGEMERLRRNLPADATDQLDAIANSIGDRYYRVVAERLLGRETEALDAMTIAALTEPDPDSPTGLAGSSAFVDAYIGRRAFASSRLRTADLGRDGGDPIERYWRTQMLIDEAAAAQRDEQRRLADAAISIGDTIDDRETADVAWAAIGRVMAAVAGAHVDDLVQEASRIASPTARATFLLGAANTLEASAADLQAVEALRSIRDEPTRAMTIRRVPGVIAPRGVAAIEMFASTIPDPERRRQTLLALAGASDPATAAAVAASVVSALGASKPLAADAGALAMAVPLLDPEAIADAEGLIRLEPDPDVRESLLVALGLRAAELGDRLTPARLRDELGPRWRPWLVRAEGAAHAAAGDGLGAASAAAELAFPAWRAELLALAAHHLKDADATDAIEAAELAAEGLDRASRASVLAAAAAAAPDRSRAALFDAAIVALDDDEEDPASGVARLGIVRALAATGALSEARATSSLIPSEPVRAEAVITTMTDVAGIAYAREQASRMSEGHARARVLTAALALAHGHVSTMAIDELQRVVEGVLLELSDGRREELLVRYPDLLPIVERLDGVGAVAMVASDLAATLEWWP